MRGRQRHLCAYREQGDVVSAARRKDRVITGPGQKDAGVGRSRAQEVVAPPPDQNHDEGKSHRIRQPVRTGAVPHQPRSLDLVIATPTSDT